jgi:hypothetical protein
MAEMEMRRDNPRIWLLQGPGKETPTSPGWSAPPRAATGRGDGDQLRTQVLALIAGIYQILQKFPEARMAVVSEVDKLPWLNGLGV